MYDMLCAGCGHRTAMMMLDEIIKEKKLKEKTILALDVACCSLLIDYVDYDAIMCAHGRVLDVTKGYKTMRQENIVISYMGDGAGYSIGMEEMVHSARRNDDVLAIIINNGLYSMTGGQVAPTNIGTKLYDSPSNGNIGLKIENIRSSFPISYLARGVLTDKENIDIAKKYIEHGGFNLVELLSPCPTNYKLKPIEMVDVINNEWTKVYKIGEFVNNV